ncbi:hypothetical protein HAX54_042506, partial [Datura stramonium]|nr:hypothetical protein [Datura stramonium]
GHAPAVADPYSTQDIAIVNPTIATVLYDVNNCVMDNVLKEVRLPAKSSYYLEQYRYNERVSAAVRPKQW